MNVLPVQLGPQSYEILVDSGILSDLGRCCSQRGLQGQVALVTNPTVSALFAGRAVASLEAAGNRVTVISIPDGEEFKTAATLGSVYDALIEAGIDRASYMVALGGGVVGDLAGYAAATFLRGIPFVQVPTTLLAQVDSSVGGKTAIDHPRGKNLIGAFYQPRLVLIDVDSLRSLPPREFRAGLAEVVKYGVALDASFFEYLEQHADQILAMDTQCLTQVIMRSCRIKADIVQQDEKESGLRAVLNYGHTLGHAFEAAAGYSLMVHGEAVAIGMMLAARVSKSCGHCSDDDITRICALLERFGLSLELPQVARNLVRSALVTDKKSNKGTISFICNRGIGMFAVEKLSIDQLFTLSGLEV